MASHAADFLPVADIVMNNKKTHSMMARGTP